MARNKPGRAVALPEPKPPATAGKASRTVAVEPTNILALPEQTRAAGLISDIAVDRFASLLMRIPDPDAVLRQAGMRREDLIRLEYDDEISGALDTRREAAISSQWKLEDEAETAKDKPTDKDKLGKVKVPEAPEQAADSPIKFVESELAKVFETMMRGAWTAVPMGYSVSEAVYAPRENSRIGIERITMKPMQWFEPLRDGRLVMTLPNSGDRIECDIQTKFLLMVRGGTYNNPFGDALLSRLYWCWFFRHVGWKSWMQFVERFGDPFVVGKSSQPSDLVTALLGMGIKNVIGVDQTTEIDVLLQSGGDTFDRLDQRLTERIQKTVLGQTLTSGTGKDGGGSYALGKVHDAVRQDKRHADCKMLRLAGQWVVDALWRLNAFPGNAPKFVFEDPKDIDLERTDRDVQLSQAGMVKFSPSYFLREYGLEPDDIEEFNIPPAPPQLPVGVDGKNPPPPGQMPQRGTKPTLVRKNGKTVTDPKKRTARMSYVDGLDVLTMTEDEIDAIAGHEVEIEVDVDGEVGVMRMNAADAVRDIQARKAALEMLE